MFIKFLVLTLGQLLIATVVYGLEDSSDYNFIESILYLETTNQNISEETLVSPEFQSGFQKHTLNNSFEVARNKATTWLKLLTKESINSDQQYILEIDRPTFDVVSVYIPKNNTSWKVINTGDSFKFDSREVDHENFLFNVSGSLLKGNRNSIYVKVKDKIISSSSIVLWERSEFNKHDKFESLMKGLYFGALFALVLFNFFIYLSVRDISYIWYVVYLGFIALFLLTYSGLAFRYFWPESPFLANYGVYLGLYISMASGLLFCRSILNIKNVSHNLSVTLLTSSVAIILVLVVGFITNIQMLSRLAPSLAIYAMLISLYCIFKSARTGYKPAYIVGASYVFVLLGGGMFALYKLGVVPGNMISRNGLQMGVLMDAFLLSFALAYRINYTNSRLQIANEKRLMEKKLFSRRLIEFQDDESKRVATNLHDSFGQKLIVIKIQMAQLFESFNLKEDDNSVKAIVGLLKELINEVREISHSLHPHQLERLTLNEALDDVIRQSFKHTQIRVTYDLLGLNKCYNKKTQLHIYRIFQGAINNILAHSNAKNVEFTATLENKHIRLLIKDDGIGIRTTWFKNEDFSKAFGFLSIRERVYSLNGQIKFISEDKNGLKILITLPRNDKDDEDDG